MKYAVALTAVVVASALGAGLSGQTPQVAPADLVLLNGRVVTVDTAKPEGQAMAVTGGKVKIGRAHV